MAAEIDRRAARSRRMLRDALMTLILRRNYEEITVQDIIDEADVGRSTFYAHFAGKDALLRSGFSELRDELHALQDAAEAGRDEPGRPAFAFSAAFFQHACDHRRIYRALIGGHGGKVMVNELERVLAELVRKELDPPPSAPGVPVEVMTQFVVATFHTVLRGSLAREPGLPASDMDAFFRQLALRGIGEPIGRGT